MAWHSYEFYEKRKNDPKWREKWKQVEQQRLVKERERENARITRENKAFISKIIFFLIAFQILISLGILYNYCVEFGINNFEQVSLADFWNFYKLAYQNVFENVMQYFHGSK